MSWAEVKYEGLKITVIVPFGFEFCLLCCFSWRRNFLLSKVLANRWCWFQWSWVGSMLWADPWRCILHKEHVGSLSRPLLVTQANRILLICCWEIQTHIVSEGRERGIEGGKAKAKKVIYNAWITAALIQKIYWNHEAQFLSLLKQFHLPIQRGCKGEKLPSQKSFHWVLVSVRMAASSESGSH